MSKPNVPVRSVMLTQNIDGHILTIYASEFVPLPKDKVSLTWKDDQGAVRELKMPPFCITNMQKVTAQMCQYVYETKQRYLDVHALTESEDELLQMTMRMAVEYASTRAVGLQPDRAKDEAHHTRVP